jgi:hypothetical protein
MHKNAQRCADALSTLHPAGSAMGVSAFLLGVEPTRKQIASAW